MKKLEFEESIPFLCAGNGIFNCKTLKFLKKGKTHDYPLATLQFKFYKMNFENMVKLFIMLCSNHRTL